MKWLNKLRDPTTRKWLRRGRRTVWGLLLLAFLWFAVVRWTTPPAAVARGTAADTDHAADDLEDLITLLDTLPPFVSQSAAWRGGWYVLPLQDVSFGAWTHDRPLIKDAVAYLTAPPTASNVLDQLDAYLASNVIGAASDVIGRNGSLPVASYPTDPRTCGQAVTAFTARARYRAAELGDLSGALEDLRAASRLVWFAEARSDQLFGYYYSFGPRLDFRAITRLEWLRTAQEHPLPPELAAEMIAFLRDELSLSAAEAVARATGIGQDPAALLDRYYTDDGHGHGWLVLSHAAPALGINQFSGARDDPGKPYSGFWNLFSPLFNDRDTVRAKLERWRHAVSRLDKVESAALESLLLEVGLWQHGYGSPTEILDGPLSGLCRRLHVESCTQLYAEVTARRALVVMLALAAYRYDHATYPDALDALVPDYLDTVPIDLNAQAPFVYARLGADRYRLASEREFATAENDYRRLYTDLTGVYSIPRPDASIEEP